MNKKTIWLIVVVLIIIAVIIGVSKNSKTTPATTIQVKIGILSPLTGNFASLGEDFSTGVRIAYDERIQKHFVIVQEDTASDAKVAISAMNKLIAEGVKIFVGGPSSSVNMALAPVAEQNKVIFIAQSKTSKMDDAGEYIFRAFPLVDKEAEMMAEFISTKSIKDVAIIFDSSSDTAIAAKDIFETKFKALGGKISAVEGFDAKTVKDFRTIVSKVKSSNPKAIYLATTEAPSGPLIKQIGEQGLTAPLFSWSVLDTERVVKIAGPAAEGLTLTAEPFACDQDIPAAQYCTAYAEKAGSTTPQYYGAYAYDLLNIVNDLIEKSNGDVEKIRAGLSNIQNNKGVVGSINIDAKGNVGKEDYIFKTVKGGKITKLEK